MNDKKADKSVISEGGKILVSIYLSPEILEELDELLFLVKKQLPIEKRRRLTKSAFYETGLKVIIESYKSSGIESNFVKKIQKLMQS